MKASVEGGLKPIAPVFRPIQAGRELILKRTLPAAGKILVKVGDWVEPHQAVGESWQSLGFRNLALARLLGVEPGEAEKLMTKPIGARIYEGQVLARRGVWRGLKKIEVLSPLTGDVTGYDQLHDQLVLAFLPQKVRLSAGIKAQVAEIVPQREVHLRARLTVLQGRLGMGRQREGMLVRAANSDLPLSSRMISTSLKGKIIFGGSVLAQETLNACLAVGVRGVICGGIEALDFAKLSTRRGQKEDVGITLLLTEGFGNQPLSAQVFDLLSEQEGRFVFLNGAGKKLFLPTEGKAGEARGDDFFQSWAVLREGQKVRVWGVRRFGQRGVIRKLLSDEKKVVVDIQDRLVKVHEYNVEVEE